MLILNSCKPFQFQTPTCAAPFSGHSLFLIPMLLYMTAALTFFLALWLLCLSSYSLPPISSYRSSNSFFHTANKLVPLISRWLKGTGHDDHNWLSLPYPFSYYIRHQDVSKCCFTASQHPFSTPYFVCIQRLRSGRSFASLILFKRQSGGKRGSACQGIWSIWTTIGSTWLASRPAAYMRCRYASNADRASRFYGCRKV